MTLQLSDLGWTPFFQSQLSLDESTTLLPARIAEVHRGHWLLWTEQGEIQLPPPRAISLTVGDWVLLSADLQQLVRALNRTSLLQRIAAGSQQQQQLLAANVDTLFILSSCDQDFSLARIERYLSLAYQADIWPVVVLSKNDLNDQYQQLVTAVQQLKNGLIVEAVDTRCMSGLAALSSWCGSGQTIALLGSSGVGKSTLANSLVNDSDENLQQTGDVRARDHKGRHTTTARTMLRLKNGGLLIDTPGMRELKLADCETGINAVFDDIEQLIQQCRFNNCRHQQEPGCAINRALADGHLDQRRLYNYQKLLKEQAHFQKSQAQQREHDRRLGKLYKRVQRGKRQQRDSS